MTRFFGLDMANYQRCQCREEMDSLTGEILSQSRIVSNTRDLDGRQF